jgi:hypothetical protein
LDFTALNATDLAIFSVLKFDDVSGQQRILGEDSSNSEGFGIGNATNGFFRGNGGSSLAPSLGATISTSGDFLYSLTRASDTITFFTKGVASGTNTRSDAFKANSIGGSTNPIDGNVKEIVIYETDQTDNRTAIEANIGEVYSIDLPSGVDPGFDQVDGFVETWYDQSGNGKDATQATAGSQPKIVNAGTMLNELDFDGTEQAGLITGSFSLTQTFTTFSVSHIDDASATQGVWSTAASATDNLNTASFFRNDDGFAVNAGSTLTTAGTIDYVADRTYLQTNVVNGGSSSIFVDGATGATGNAGSTNPSGVLVIGYFKSSGYFNLDGGIKELIIYDSDQTSTRPALETNIAAEYGITLS